MNFTKFKQLEVVNLLDGKILGNITDFIVDLSEGRIEAIIIPGSSKFMTLFNKDEYIIPWAQIKKIGDEVILVAHDGKYNINSDLVKSSFD